MRIRKRQVPLPLSSLLPVPLSDLYSNRSPTTTASYFCGQDRDGVLASLLQLSQPPAPVSDGQQRDVIDKKQEKALDDDGIKSSADASGSKNVNPTGESDSSTQVVEKNENVVTLRKRRRGFISFEEQEEDDEEEASGGGGGSKGKKKKAKKNGTLEEGSRCSRVNGRGWRCFQQTLYGYSLCEHHLGKGRVRSMNKSAGGRGGRDKKKAVVVEVKSKRVKLGMVKARSISSLLGQTSTSSGTAESEISTPADQFTASDK
ncbi:hypothetical protein HID58_058174 [Brassica napus]|uniref:WRC domain-containing protein n=3 Tax=Brassica TaxID=3705 RepID=A0ABQ7ZPE4_BRANA|nr:uncharacterized protein LOC106394748 [Brassica napus]KAF3555474.1 hypothetical protein F2Q69_00010488 [Brassica cretica]KAF3577238.1 hypothetical protein DY000_02028510 [Brassica cretica]KAH0882078.1 hypothetical protein HID58_058174 [Brassica napus]